jgi:putative PIN family toxin of toxin-antitoxin system
MKIVLDTTVLVAAARSKQSASYTLVAALPSPLYQICLSVTLYMEWQDVLSRAVNLPPSQTPSGARQFLRYLASVAHLQNIYFLWRPFLRDPADDMVLELAVAAGARFIVTHNLRDFARATTFGVQAITPGDFYEKYVKTKSIGQ